MERILDLKNVLLATGFTAFVTALTGTRTRCSYR